MSGDRTTVQLNQLLDHCQANAHTSLRTIRARFSLAEDFENVWQERRVNSLPIVLDTQDDLIGFSAQLNRNVTILRRELHRVIQQVPDDLFQPDWISFHKNQ